MTLYEKKNLSVQRDSQVKCKVISYIITIGSRQQLFYQVTIVNLQADNSYSTS